MIYGQTQGFGVGAPISALYTIEMMGSGARALRHFFGRFVSVSDDQFLGIDGPLLPAHVREMKKKGTLRDMDPECGEPEFHRVIQYAVAIEKSELATTVQEGDRPSIYVACMIEHEMEGSVWYSAERGVLTADEAVRSPISFTAKNRQAALKKWDAIVTSWEEIPGGEFETARFVHPAMAKPEDWHFAAGGTGSTVWRTTMSWLGDAEARRQAEMEKLLKAPLTEMADETFAQVFQREMARGKK